MSERVYFHCPCIDGLFGAYFYYKEFTNRDIQYIPSKPGRDIQMPEKECYLTFIDMVPTINTVKQMANNPLVLGVRIIDHHKGNNEIIDLVRTLIPTAQVVFEQWACGAKLVLSSYSDLAVTYPILAQIADYIDDKDRWIWALENSKQVSTYLNTLIEMPTNEKTTYIAFNTIDQLFLTGNITIELMAARGQAYDEYANVLIEQAVRGAVFTTMTVPSGTYKIAHVSSKQFRSEIGSVLITRYEIDFSVCWHYDPVNDQFVLSLRSDDNHVDVDKIAKELGGGGHRNASGCSFPYPFHRYIT